MLQFYTHIEGDSHEARAARLLRDILEKTAPKDLKGEIVISANQPFYSYDTQDVDILLYGRFENLTYKVQDPSVQEASSLFDVYKAAPDLRSDAKSETSKQVSENKPKRWPATLYVNEVCLAIEVKSHSPKGVQIRGSGIEVRYSNHWHGASEQATKQRFTVMSFFKDHLKRSPPVSSVVWLTEFDKTALADLLADHPNRPPVFSDRPAFNDVISEALIDRPPRYASDKHFFLHGDNRMSDGQRVVEQLRGMLKPKQVEKGALTKKKLEMLSRRLLDEQDYVQAIEEGKLVIIRGRAGTGKTLKLLRIAVELAVERSRRCLILTYNHALVFDIRRLLVFHGKTGGYDKTVEISTLHKYFYDLLVGFGLLPQGDSFLDQGIDAYLKQLTSLTELLSAAESTEEIQSLMNKHVDLVAFDHVFIDESQDWYEPERDLIRTIFRNRSVIVSDGQDQLVRHGLHCDWIQGLGRTEVHRKQPEKKSLRQKRGIVYFANAFAQECELDWDIDASDDLIGGRVVIIKSELTPEHIQRAVSSFASDRCVGYDLLIAVPSGNDDTPEALLDSVKLGENHDAQPLGCYDFRGRDKKRFGVAGQIPMDPDKARLVYYNSLRGIESWTLIAKDVDLFLEKIGSELSQQEDRQLRLETEEERVQRLASYWALIAFTRPADTLIIELKNPGSEWSRRILRAAEAVPDQVEYW